MQPRHVIYAPQHGSGQQVNGIFGSVVNSRITNSTLRIGDLTVEHGEVRIGKRRFDRQLIASWSTRDDPGPVTMRIENDVGLRGFTRDDWAAYGNDAHSVVRGAQLCVEVARLVLLGMERGIVISPAALGKGSFLHVASVVVDR